MSGGLVARGVAHDVAARARRVRPRPAVAVAAGGAGRVVEQTRDLHVGMAGVGPDRDPLAGSGAPIGLELAGVLGRGQQAAAVERVADRARAVVTARAEAAVT